MIEFKYTGEELYARMERGVTERRWNFMATAAYFAFLAILLCCPLSFVGVIVSKYFGSFPRTNLEEHRLWAAVPKDFPAVRVKNETSSTGASMDYAAYHGFDLVDTSDRERIDAWLKIHGGEPLEEYQRDNLFAAPDWFMADVRRHNLQWLAVTLDLGRAAPDFYAVGRDVRTTRFFLIILKP